jgi:nicotinamidase-related amidase
MVCVLILKAVDCVFICGIMVSMLVLKAVDHGFIAGVMVNVLVSLLRKAR